MKAKGIVTICVFSVLFTILVFISSWKVSKKVMLVKDLVGKKFSHLPEIWSPFADFLFTDKVNDKFDVLINSMGDHRFLIFFFNY